MEDPVDAAGWVTRFPDIKAARIVENSLYLGGLILGILLVLVLYRALRETSLAPALFGGILGAVGLAILAAGALPHVATAPLSDLYHDPGTTPTDQATLALMWQATWAVFDALLAVGFIVLLLGLTALGVAMLGTPAFGKSLGWASVVLGVLGLIAAILNMVETPTIGAVSFLTMIIFFLVLGWKVYSLSRSA